MEVSSINSAVHDQGISLRQAALTAGIGILIMAIAGPFAELVVYPKLVIPGKIEETVRNISANQGFFLAGVFAYLIIFVCDVLVAWALYVLLIPVNRTLSLLTAWFRLVYAVIALFGLSNLVTVFRLLNTPDYLTVFGSDQLHAQVRLLLNSFHYEWGMGLMLFGIHLGLLGYLVYRSDYIPRILGVLLAVAGLGWVIDSLKPYLYPDADLGFIMITFFGELIFMLWLLVRGWKIQEPIPHS
ncbi:MAG: DUF4386 domain-containing protein [Woeseia sp.]